MKNRILSELLKIKTNTMKLERSFSFDLTDWQRETLKENFNFNAEEEI